MCVVAELLYFCNKQLGSGVLDCRLAGPSHALAVDIVPCLFICGQVGARRRARRGPSWSTPARLEPSEVRLRDHEELLIIGIMAINFGHLAVATGLFCAMLVRLIHSRFFSERAVYKPLEHFTFCLWHRLQAALRRPALRRTSAIRTKSMSRASVPVSLGQDEYESGQTNKWER